MTDKDNVTYMFGDIAELTEVPEEVGGLIDDTVNIPRSEYEELLESRAWLEALEAAGVDNWDGFDYAQETYNQLNEELGG